MVTRRDFLKAAGVGAAAVTAATLAACSADEEETPNTPDDSGNETPVDPSAGGTIDVETTGEQIEKVTCTLEYNSFSVAPFGGQSTGRDYFIKHLYGFLFFQPTPGTAIEDCEPYIAKSLEKVDDYTYNIEIYEGITDSKGNSITAEDVVYSLERNYEESEMTAFGTYMDSMEIVDDTHLILHLKMFGSNVLESVLANHRSTIINKAWYESATDDEKMYDPACTGPYTLVSYTPGAQVIIEARDDYWKPVEERCIGEATNVKTVEFNVVTEAAMRTIALQNEETDMSPVQVAELYHFYDLEAGQNMEGWNANISPSRFVHHMYFNMDPGMSPVADDKNLRLAIQHAINPRDIYMAAGYDDNTAVACVTLGCSTMGGYNPEWETRGYYNYDLDKAKEYMAASNYPDGLTLRLLGRPDYDAMLSLIANELLAINITLELNLFEQSLFNNYKYDSTAWDLIHDNKGYTFFGYCFQGLFNNTGYENGGVNFWKDEKLWELAQKCFETQDQADIDECEAYIYEGAGVRGLFNYYDVNVAQDGVAEVKVHNGVLDPCASVYAADFTNHGA